MRTDQMHLFVCREDEVIKVDNRNTCYYYYTQAPRDHNLNASRDTGMPTMIAYPDPAFCFLSTTTYVNC